MLILREFEQSDRNRIVAILNCPEVTELLSSRIPLPYTVADADWWLETGCKQGLIRAIEIDGELAGCIGVEPGQHEYAFTGEVGYWLAKEYWHQGHATEALKQLLALIPPETFVRLQATVFDRNTPSCKVLEKCGFKLEANLEKALYKNGSFYNALLYGKLVS
ncbi:GNAT family N-acetyltransferase [Desulfuromonas acetoxidans]|uniref:GCN5-related N-acetyltransferase n=1 Tax=Desulfuromonas acetoxidans (strain DSM 684 / 11070) TaxID=281689 RepID=Q1K2Q9_DESA6|nr:GNAT family N-acetyltransferase [Desulfuromonas acetoxidans]EAT16822.1 GCN5-related N-acetyltransferase [Desulfuromonas acetoxidans DSM 684]MBF0644629.1 GNAT family N-acetyltransferase [Desulfuromonas acetoxidans]NVD23764.1 GNAT family N-acetyltransferase [Desulfuromonas acetoxidans]NVE15839.1 GNAT family N-acetyltransferase [Desulfuromonas acetoxidans]